MRWVFFDIGSTLVDESNFNRYLLDKTYNSMISADTKIEWEDFNNELKSIIEQRRYGDRAYRGIIKELVTHFSGDEALIQRVLEDYRRNAVKEYLDRMRPYPDALKVVRELKKKYRLGVIANQPRQTRQKMISFGLAEQFEVVVLSDDVRLRKPDTRIFFHAFDFSGCDPREAIMVGDRLDTDIEPARSLGMTAVRVKQGIMIHQIPLNSLEVADYEVDTLRNLVNIL
ncbi:MAG: HAD family hydrolase [Nitrososphaeria archaeon]